MRHKMNQPNTAISLRQDLSGLGLCEGDGVFVHASLKAIGPTVGGARTVVQALLDCVGETGLLGMPGFSTDAYFPADIDAKSLTPDEMQRIRDAVPGFDPAVSPAEGMGVIAETFRTWPGTQRSAHPTTSVCLRGRDADRYLSEHSLSWSTGEQTPFGTLRQREEMKILLIGVGWNRCTVLHTAETLAPVRRTKMRCFKTGRLGGHWTELPDIADDNSRLFPSVGAAYEATGQVRTGLLGAAECRVCDYADLVTFATDWISAANQASGDRH